MNNDNEYKSFGAYLKSLREEKDLIPEELGEKLDIKIEKIKRWERDLEVPDLDEMYKLSEFYDVPCEHLLRLKDELFKPNLKMVRAIAAVLGVSVRTIIIIGYTILVLALFGAVGLFMFNSERIKNEEGRLKQAANVARDYFSNNNY